MVYCVCGDGHGYLKYEKQVFRASVAVTGRSQINIIPITFGPFFSAHGCNGCRILELATPTYLLEVHQLS